MSKKSKKIIRIFIVSLPFLFGLTLIVLGIMMQHWWELNRAKAALPAMRSDFALMRPYLDILREELPDYVTDFSPPTVRDGVEVPLRVVRWVQLPYRSFERREVHYFDEWHTLDWLPQNVSDAVVFLLTSSELSHQLRYITVNPLGTGTVEARVELNQEIATLVVFYDSRGHRPADASVGHLESLDGGYFLRIQIYWIMPVIGRYIVGAGVIIILGYLVFLVSYTMLSRRYFS